MASPSPLRPPDSLNVFNTSSMTSPVIPPPQRNVSTSSLHRPRSSLSTSSTPSIPGMTPNTNVLSASKHTNLGFRPAIPPPPNKPNYNISIPSSTSTPPPIPSFPLRSTSSLTAPTTSSTPPPSMAALFPQSSLAPQPMRAMASLSGNVMAPSKPAWNASASTRTSGIQPLQPKNIGKDDWEDFDPLA